MWLLVLMFRAFSACLGLVFSFLPFLALGVEYKMAVLDMSYVVQNSLASKTLHQQLDAAKRKLAQKSSDKEKEFYQIDKNLSEQRNVLAQEVFESKVQDFTKSVVEAQRKIKEENSKIEAAYSSASDTIAKKIEAIVSKIIEDKQIDVVLPRLPRPYPLYVSSKVMDISKLVLEALDAELQSVSMEPANQ